MGLFDVEPPAAYGESEDDVLRQLEVMVRSRELGSEEPLERYLWSETFQVRRATVEIFPLSQVKKQPVIGARRIPLKLSYAWARLKSGAYRVMLPRFGWWMILEDLDTAPEVLGHAVSSALLGENPRWVYDFRHEQDEYVRSWSPDLLRETDLASTDERADEPPETLGQVADELVERAMRRKLPLTVGPDPIDDELLRSVLRDAPPSLLLVGPAGVGKSAWVRWLARRIAALRRDRRQVELRRLGGGDRDQLPRIWRTSGERIIAGMVYLGQWQKRCLDLVEELSDEGDLLYVDRLTSILQPQPDGTSIAALLYPALAAGEISLLAECTEAELAACRQRFDSFVGQFQLVRLRPTERRGMPELMTTYLQKKAPQLSITPAGLRRLIAHLEAFDRASSLPGKGFRLIDWLIEQLAADQTTTLDASEASAAFGKYSGLPIELIADDFQAGAAVISDSLARRVIGQPTACDICGRVLARLKAGLNDPERPVASLLFVGPTGVGKTELAKQLTRFLFSDERRMVRLDMSEYAGPGAAARLLSVGPGVSSLAQRVRQQPLSLVLLDEIEKAAPEVFDLLLGVLGEGRLTDSLGRQVDFRMTLIVMTSNLGASDNAPVGFGERVRDDYLQAVKKHFRPELFNRLDHVIAFGSLGRDEMLRIVDLELAAVAQRPGFARRRLRLRVDDEARALLARLGFNPTRGARPLKRVIEERVVAPLAQRLSAAPDLADAELTIDAAALERV